MHFNDTSSSLAKEKKRLLNGRELNPFDDEVVEIVAALTLRLKEARETIEREGQIVDDGKGFPVEHPALLIEKRASMELRGWVKDRQDLFGPAKSSGSSRPKRQKFQVVK